VRKLKRRVFQKGAATDPVYWAAHQIVPRVTELSAMAQEE
jgi:hypothetical protein